MAPFRLLDIYCDKVMGDRKSERNKKDINYKAMNEAGLEASVTNTLPFGGLGSAFERYGGKQASG